MMDLGATLCTRTRPRCGACPLRADCRAEREGRQSELPTPKPKKAVPERATTMLLIASHGRLWLERRPPTGIWGGLWSLPEAETAGLAADVCRQRFGFAVRASASLPLLTHTFTHFRLTITPLLVDLTGSDARVADESARWFTASEALRAGIPTPVRKLILAWEQQAKPIIA
jgi:A/G-specific adenine glycosylase